MVVELSQEQVESILAPVKAVIEAKLAEVVVGPSPAVYTEEQLQAAVLSAKLEEKERLKSLWEAKNAEQDAAVVAEIFA
jgi:hypothetical protein